MKQSMKQFFKKLNETNVSKKYIIIVLGISMLMVCSYFSYAMFTVSKEKQNAIKIVTGNLTYKLTVNGTTATSITVPAKTTNEYTVVLTNTNSRTARFNFYYIETTDVKNYLNVGYVTKTGASELPAETGVNLNQNATNTYNIKITNSSSSSKTLKLGVEVGLDYNDLALPTSSSSNIAKTFSEYVKNGSVMKAIKLSHYYNTAVKVVTKGDNTVPSGATNVQDLSEDGDNSIVGYMDSDKTLTIGGPKKIIAQDGVTFNGMRNATEIDLTYFDTSNMTNMNSMFMSCSKLTTLNISNFDTSKVTNMNSMFNYCSALTTLDLSNFDTSSVTTMSSMFASCSALITLDLSNFDTSNVTEMESMFDQCKALTTLDISNFDTSSVTTMRRMFCYCQALRELDLSSFDTANVTDMGLMFAYSSKLIDIYVGDYWVINDGTTTNSMFMSCGTDEVTQI
mgnify:CR=1 FL=1